jgi:SSS family solute:Na+ symporter
MKSLQTGDYLVFAFYFLVVAIYGWWVYQRKKNVNATSQDYFLAEGSLTWWAIGASLIASNISAEQFIGMSGSGFQIGLAVSTYEWMAALTLVIVAVFFIPVYLKNKIFTMPQFLKQRYNGTVAMIMAIFWLLLYVIVNLTSILFLGSLAVSSISGFDFTLCLYALAIFAIIIALGGMKVIGYTDVIQVFFLILGGLVTTYIALELVANKFGDAGVLHGFSLMMSHSNDHFHMILPRESSNYSALPGLSVLIGGMWITNLSYWGCNQYITQRALGADLKTARSGILFAAFLKLLMPVIVVLPGIAAYVLYKQNMFQAEMLQGGEIRPDRAYPVLLNLLPPYMKGLAFAALTAAVVASLAGKVNSIATIFTLDVYKNSFNKNVSEKGMVIIGKISVVVAMFLGVILCTHLGIDKKGGFEFIQEYTGFVSPGILAMFLLGFFWKKATSNAAMFATIGGFAFSVFFKKLPLFANLEGLKGWGWSTLVTQGDGSKLYEIPFLDRMAIVFVICMIGMYIISMIENRKGLKTHGLEVDTKMFKAHPAFIAGSLIICGILTALYTIFW